MTKLNALSCGWLLACSWGFIVWTLGILSQKYEWSTNLVELFSKIYVGYRSSLSGSLIGAMWGFCDGFISGFLIASIYNIFVTLKQV